MKEKKETEAPTQAMPPVDTVRGGNLAPGGPPPPKPETAQYPSWRYNKDGIRSKVVKSEEENAALGPDWGPDIVPPPAPPKPVDLSSLPAQFDDLQRQCGALRIKVDVMEKSVAALTEAAGRGKRQ